MTYELKRNLKVIIISNLIFMGVCGIWDVSSKKANYDNDNNPIKSLHPFSYTQAVKYGFLDAYDPKGKTLLWSLVGHGLITTLGLAMFGKRK